MSALARFFKHYNKEVVGYDKIKTKLTTQLENEGITCHYIEDVASLNILLKTYSKDEVLVIYTPAIPLIHKEYIFLQERDYTILKRSQVLGEISSQFRTIAIAGTHGKTTTTTLVTHILKCAAFNCFSFMGGISNNYNTNILLGDINNNNSFFVVEADEYDRSFLTLKPEIAIITSVDADHLDIYGDEQHVKDGYLLFSKCISSNGTLVVKKNVENDLKLTSKRLVYSLNLDTEYCADSIKIEDADFVYNIKSSIEPINDVTLGLPGLHNVENSIAAVAVAQLLGVNANIIKSALRSFNGVKRRFDYRVKSNSVVFIDDYAHHPEELKAIIGSVKKIYPNKKITGIFQPHLYTRTRDFVEGFAESLSLLDVCLLLEIYPARELPIEGVNSNWLLNKVNCKDKLVVSKEEAMAYVKTNAVELLVTMGAGDIDGLVEPIEKILKSKV